MTEDCLEPRALALLKWRSRRGLLENDLILERFFARHGAQLTQDQADVLQELMALPDPPLLDLLLARTRPDGPLDRPEVHALLQLLRPVGAPNQPEDAAPAAHNAKPEGRTP